MPTLLQYIFAIGTFQGFLLSALLLFTSNISYASRILGVWCGFLAAGLMLPLVLQLGTIEAYGFLLALTGFLPASFGALLYLYCRHSVLDDGFRAKDLLHFIPFVSCYLLNIDLLFSPDQVVQMFVEDTRAVPTRYSLGQFILFGQAYIYIFYTAIYMYRYQQRAQDNYAGFNPDIFDWLWILQGFNLLIWSLKAAGMLIPGFGLLISGDVLIVILIYGIGLAQWRNPQLFKIAVPVAGDTTVSGNDLGSRLAGKLDEDTRLALMASVNQYVRTHQAFLDSELSLRRLSDAIGISTHHLSETLNGETGQNFYNYVNKLRVEYVCEHLKRDQEIKLLDLGLQAGFSSKSTFNSVFKKQTGLTPTQYRNNCMGNTALS
jgi:AraC-like DNA-binding protein